MWKVFLIILILSLAAVILSIIFTIKERQEADFIAKKYKWKPIRSLSNEEVRVLKHCYKCIDISEYIGFCPSIGSAFKLSYKVQDSLLNLINKYRTTPISTGNVYWFNNCNERKALIKFLIKHKDYKKV